MSDKVLNMLNNKGSFVSGQEISTSLGITRAAVWKKIQGLRNRGFVIDAAPSKGYRFISAPELAKDYLLAGVSGSLWKELLVHTSVESTNDLAMSLAVGGGIAPGTVLIADQQTKGKGRLGRKWASPGGMNIYMSLVIRPELAPGDITMLTILAAVAGASALRLVCNIPVEIKWPNDLTFSDKKLGGILIEVRADPDRINLAVIGVGINVNMAARDFPEEIRGAAVSLMQVTGKRQSRNDIIIRLLTEFERWYGLLITEGKRPLLDAWRKYSSTLGRRVMVALGETSISGIAEDIDDNGMLVLKTQSGQQRKISAGDISLC
jgi:BirA family biotin operon repressor/biotin-[acetyl-CoA-carboxylase] ligase